MRITAEGYNRRIREVEKYFPRTTSDLTGDEAFSHPWQVTMISNPFPILTPKFLPGLVNGFPPYIDMAYKDAPLVAQERIKKLAETNGEKLDKEKSYRVYIDETPSVPLFWRAFDPKEKDVRPPKFGPAASSDIQATDIIVQTLRTTIASGVTKTENTDGTTIDVDIKFIIPSPYGFKLLSVAKYVPPQSFLSSADIVAGRFFDNPFEAVKICTIYALRPRGGSSSPDITWSFATTYDAYWNILFFAPFTPVQDILNRISFVSPLAGGALQAAVFLGQLFAANNDFSQATADFINKNKLLGRWIAI
jgi:hypothetical protein